LKLSNAELYKIAKNKSTTIWYCHGMRGNSIYRIIAAHPEVYWDNKVQQNSLEETTHPLDLPELVAAFDPPDGRFFGTPDIIGRWKFAYATYHTNSFIDDDNYLRVVRSWITSESYKNKILFSSSHPNWPSGATCDKKKLLTLTDKPHIWLYGSLNRNYLSSNKSSIHKYYEPSPHPLAYNINIDNLYSQDYLTFETEYYKLIKHFNLTSCLNRVRAFILLNLERDKYIVQF
jgi:hypothetical protein